MFMHIIISIMENITQPVSTINQSINQLKQISQLSPTPEQHELELEWLVNKDPELILVLLFHFKVSQFCSLST